MFTLGSHESCSVNDLRPRVCNRAKVGGTDGYQEPNIV